MTLRLLIELGPEETAQSFASRLAARNGRSLYAFCQDMGLSTDGVIRGEPASIAEIARLGAVAPEQLVARAVRQASASHKVIGAEVVADNRLARGAIRYCPRCANQNLARSPGSPAHAAIPDRLVHWIPWIETCLDHDTPLVEVAMPAAARIYSTFPVERAATLGSPGHKLILEGRRRKATPFERYIAARVAAGAAANMDGNLLAELPLAGVADACEALGAAVLAPASNGGKARHDRLAKRQAGFEMLGDGFDALKDRAMRRWPEDRSFLAAHRLGSFGRWIAARGKTSSVDGLRPAVRRLIHETSAAGPSDEILGEVMTTRHWHSPVSIGRAAGVADASIWRICRNLGLADGERPTRPRSEYLVDVVSGERIVASLAGSATHAEVARILGARVALVHALVDAGVLRLVAGTGRGGVDGRIERAGVDRLLVRLAVHAPVGSPPCALPPQAAIKRTRARFADIVAAIAEGRLRAFREAGPVTIGSLRVRPADVAAAMRAPDFHRASGPARTTSSRRG